jgi:succinyl-diaminopimelate desuccinylase
MSALEEVFKQIDESRDEIITLQADLTSKIALGPENGGSGEHQKSNYLKKKMEALKPDSIEEIRSPDERAEDGYRPNLVARWGAKKPGPGIWVLSHMDIVPPGDPALWESDPYRIKVDGDKIIGRGVLDNQAGIVSSYLALEALQKIGQELGRSVGLIFVADEETGSKYGLEYLLQEQGTKFHPDDLIIVPDGGNESGTIVEVAEKSMLWLKFTVVGKQCHASTPSRGKNSLYGTARLIIALESLKKGFDEFDKLFSPPSSTFEPTKMEANVPNINTIPGRDVFYLDCRILPQYQVDDIIGFAKEKADDVAGELDLSITVEAGLSAAVWMTMPDSAHQPNEYCLISNIMNDAKVFASLYLNAYGT